MSSKIDKWARWLEVIKQQTYAVMERRHIYKETTRVLSANPALPKTSAFYTWLHTSYADSVVMTVRRQIKSGAQSISLVRLLEEIEVDAKELSRTRWRALYEGTVLEGFADRHFDDLAGKHSEHVRAELVHADCERFKSAVGSIETWADKRIAHFDRGDPPQAPTFDDLDRALDSLDKLLRKYYLLVTGDAIAFTTPVIQHNWKKVFELAWLPRQT